MKKSLILPKCTPSPEKERQMKEHADPENRKIYANENKIKV
jgi:hypothetical protein